MLQNLKKLRIQKQMTQKALADVVGTSQQSINKYENHNVEPDIAMLKKLAAHFDTTIDYICWLQRHPDSRVRAGAGCPDRRGDTSAHLFPEP